MDFGKLPDISRVDFRLPPLSAETRERNDRVLARAHSLPATPPSVHVGAPIWSQKQWLGRVYPLGTPSRDFLPRYARQFNGIELNSTHYHIPTPEAVREWKEQTPPGFKFCPKFPQAISHEHELAGCEPLTRMFCSSVTQLGDRLGTTFLQLSPYFSPDRLPILERFLKTLPPGFPLCVEFRHPAWFTDHELSSRARDVLEAAGAGTVVTDTAGRRDVVHFSVTAPRLLIRFVGNQLHPTDTTRVDDWVARLEPWLRQGLRELYFFVHQPDNDLAPELISHLIARLNATGLTKLSDWQRMDQGTQIGLFG